jgi:alcohol dehydrogenase (cytochrome c)
MDRRSFSRGFARLAGLILATGLLTNTAGEVARSADESDPANWPLPAHGYDGNRYVKTTQITPANVAQLKRTWQFKIGDDAMMEAAPIVSNGTIYVTTGHDGVYALDAKTGLQKWSYLYPLSHVIALYANRGVALLNGRLYLGTLDGHVLALDAASGRVLWNVVGVDEPTNSYYAMAPIPYRNLILIGASNGDWGGNGYVSAFDANTGKRVWEWQTIPKPGAPGHETWSGDSWKRGGGAVWGGLAIDPASATLYIDTGNPQPDLIGTNRTGANLFTDSMIALDISGPRSPRLKWYHQFIAHDTHDWDPALPPVRFAATVNGTMRELVAAGDKGGNFWVLDAGNGSLVQHAVVSTQTMQQVEPNAQGEISCPGTNGGVQYNGGAYLPETNAFYLPSMDQCQLFKAAPTATYIAGELYTGGSSAPVGPSTGWMNAIDVGSGRFLWRRKLPLPGLGGALAFSSGLVFTGQLNGDFEAYNARTGAVLWHFATGAPIKAPPATYVADGKQYIIVASGAPGENFSVPGVPTTNDGAIISAFALP